MSDEHEAPQHREEGGGGVRTGPTPGGSTLSPTEQQGNPGAREGVGYGKAPLSIRISWLPVSPTRLKHGSLIDCATFIS
jgi:hypothetical protein